MYSFIFFIKENNPNSATAKLGLLNFVRYSPPGPCPREIETLLCAGGCSVWCISASNVRSQNANGRPASPPQNSELPFDLVGFYTGQSPKAMHVPCRKEKLTLSNEYACFRLVKFRSLTPLRDALKIYDFQGPPSLRAKLQGVPIEAHVLDWNFIFHCICGFLHRAKPEGYARTLQEEKSRVNKVNPNHLKVVFLRPFRCIGLAIRRYCYILNHQKSSQKYFPLGRRFFDKKIFVIEPE